MHNHINHFLYTVLAKSLERLEKKNITVTVFTLLFFSGFYTAIA